MSLVGTNVRRSDGEAKVTGEALYALDYEEPHYLHAKVLRATVPAARIVRLDTSKAAGLPGVHAIVTAADAPQLHGFATKDQPLFARDEIRYEGEPIAAVAAETWNAARAALRAIEVELEPLPVVATMEDALADGARLVHAGFADYGEVFPLVREGNVAALVSLERGEDVDALFAGADVVVEDEFQVGRHHQSSIEPRVCVARHERGRWTIHTSTQWPFSVRDGTAAYLGVRPSDVRVIVPTVGGGFGGKLLATLEPIAALLARESGRPVKLANTRKEEFLSGAPREGAIVRIRTAVASDGTFLAHDSDVVMDNGAYGGEQPVVAGMAPLMVGNTYRYRGVRNRTRLVYTNTPPTGAFRGVLSAWATFALERHVDRIAGELGIDRRELRLKNVYRDGDLTATGQVLEGVAFQAAFERLEERVPWAQLAGARAPHRGVGLACTVWPTNGMPSGAVVKLNEDGTIGLVTSACEIGTGAVTQGLIQIVAEELGVAPEDVHVTSPDTDATPNDSGAQGQRTVFGSGRAALAGATEVREQVLRLAAGMLEADEGDLDLVDGAVLVRGAPERRLTLASLAQAALYRQGPITGRGAQATPPIPHDPGCASGTYVKTMAGATYHLHLAEVEVDPETGRVAILRYVVVQDVGRALNPKAIEGQVHGGVLQGVGYALFEELRLDGGVCVDDGFARYRLPTALDAPPIELELLEFADPLGPHGVKGAAEAPIIPVAAAIANAVADAIGRPVSRLPITPFAVLAALHDGNGTP